MGRSDEAVIGAIQANLMNADVIAATLRKALARFKPAASRAEARRLESRSSTGDCQPGAGPGGNLQTLVQAIRERASNLQPSEVFGSQDDVLTAGECKAAMIEKGWS